MVSVADQADDVVPGELLPPPEEGELHEENEGAHGGSEPLRQLTGRPRRPAGGNHVVHDEDTVSGLEGVLVHLDAVGAVLELVADLDRLPRQLSGLSADTATGGPAGVTFPFGTVFYKTTSGIGESLTTTLNFSSALPANVVLYKVDETGTYTEIPATQWTITGSNSLDLTLTDGGPFDLDGAANGVIVDPIALGVPIPNAPPSAPTLISPNNGQTGLGTTVDFQWNASTDADGDAITYDFFICENDTFTGTDCGATTVAAAALKGLTQFASYGGGLFVFGIACIGGLKRKTPALMLTAGLALSACGGGGGSGGGGGTTSSHQESGLNSSTTYYWKVVASDGISTTESEVRTFTTQ